MASVDVSLVDVCLGCYLTDHHNRRGELLLGVIVDNTTTVAEINEQLKSELQSADYGLPSWFSYRQAERAIDAECSPTDNSVFDTSLDPPDEEGMMDEPCQAWFLLTYSRK